MPQSITDIIPIEELDSDGAIREGAESIEADSRADFFRKAGVAGAGLATSGLLLGGIPQLASAAAVAKSDIAILNFALTLEYLEREFYTEALKNINLNGDLDELTQLVHSHEVTHVMFLQNALGKAAIKKPKFNFHGATRDARKYAQLAFVLENTGVHAYLGQAGKIKNKTILGSAAKIVTIEARHASAFAVVVHQQFKGKNGITPNGAFDKPFSKKAILKAAGKFIVS